MNGTLTSWGIKVYGHSSAPADTVTVTTASANVLVRIDSPISVTATFSKPVSGFTVDDVSVANGTASNFVGSDGSSVYTFDVTPNAIRAVTVDIAAGAAQDSNGNGNIARLNCRWASHTTTMATGRSTRPRCSPRLPTTSGVRSARCKYWRSSVCTSPPGSSAPDENLNNAIFP